MSIGRGTSRCYGSAQVARGARSHERVGRAAGCALAIAIAFAGAAPPAGAAIGPDGLIAFETTDGTRTVKTIDPSAAAADALTLPNLPAGSANPAWSADGTMLAFSSTVTGVASIYVIRADGSGLRQITQGSDPAIDPTWSPDGRLAFTGYSGSARDIYVTDVNAAAPVRLTADGLSQQAAWSPDGTRIAYETDATGNRDIWLMAPDGSAQQRLTTSANSDSDADWSPDGRRLAFSSGVPRAYERAIYSIGADGSDLQQLTPSRSRIGFPAWSPDGRQIAFAENGTVKRMASQGLSSQASETVVATSATDPVWARLPAPPAADSKGDVKVTTPTGKTAAADGPLPEGTMVDATGGSVTVSFLRPAVATTTPAATAKVKGALFTVAETTPEQLTLRVASPQCPGAPVVAAKARRGNFRVKVRGGRRRGHIGVRTDHVILGDHETSYTLVETCRGSSVAVSSGRVTVRARSCSRSSGRRRCQPRGRTHVLTAGTSLFLPTRRR
ncbi:MAG: TolB protein [Solirubrobacteraceae bacterium]|nr:TolB protein [Solirubrobacteraceae bacterium]